PADRQLSDRPRSVLDDDEPLDCRAGPGHAPACSEADRSTETDLANAVEGGGRRRRRREGCEAAEARRPAARGARGRRRREAAQPPDARRPAARGAQEEEAGETVTEDLFVEATGETVGEAKWAALRELERQRPGVDRNTGGCGGGREGGRGPAASASATARGSTGARSVSRS